MRNAEVYCVMLPMVGSVVASQSCRPSHVLDQCQSVACGLALGLFLSVPLSLGSLSLSCLYVCLLAVCASLVCTSVSWQSVPLLSVPLSLGSLCLSCLCLCLLAVCPLVCLDSPCLLPGCLFACLFVCLCLCACLPNSPSICLSIRLAACLPA